MKEIIYLDTNQMNSMLAQLDEGIINSFSMEQSNQEAETEGQQSTRGKSAGIQGGASVGTGLFPGGGLNLKASLGNNGNESTSESRTILEGQKDVLNKAFHDHSLEVLTSKLIENQLLSDERDLVEGKLYLGESSYRFYDFDLLKNAIDHEFMKKITIGQSGVKYKEVERLLTKNNPNARERELLKKYKPQLETIKIFEQLNMVSEFAATLLDGLTILKAGNYIGLLKKEYLRESTEALSFRTTKNRKIKFLVRVIGVKKVVITDFNMPILQENDLDAIPNMMLDIILGSFSIIKENDLIVAPIAIYYE